MSEVWLPIGLLFFTKRSCFCPPLYFPPEKSLTFPTAVLIFILFIVVVVGVQDRPIGVRVAGPALPGALLLRGTGAFCGLSHQPRGQQLVFGCETAGGTETQGWCEARSNFGTRPGPLEGVLVLRAFFRLAKRKTKWTQAS